MGDNEYSLFSILALVFAFLFFPLGIIFDFIALNEIKKNFKLKGKILAWIGILSPPAIVIAGFLFKIISGIFK